MTQLNLFTGEEIKAPAAVVRPAVTGIAPEHWASLTEQEKLDVKWVEENL